MRSTTALMCLVFSLATACGSARSTSPTATDTAAPATTKSELAVPRDTPPPPALRLPRTVLPESNRVRLTLDPREETFRGHIDIVAVVSAPTDFFWLNQENITVATASVAVGGEVWPLQVHTTTGEYVGFRAPQPLPAGKVTISIGYSGLLDALETEGIFRQQAGDHWYLYTQFEATDARRAFPCFDEPDNKVPWQVTLEVPAGDGAFSNTPIASERVEGSMRIVEFKPTPPLPSYLVAFAVGPFDVVDGGVTRSGTPMRVVVPKGMAGDVQWVVDTTGPVLALLEDYFGMPYPYEKLDSIAIPLTVGFGAMENPGLITYSQRLLVAKPDERTIRYERAYVDVAAHELAHQWFGNLVTMKFWDDIWLNEAFASWMGDKVVLAYKPEWGSDVSLVNRRGRALSADRLKSARQIRQPIRNDNDIKNAFDGITYSKGAAVIQMFETWVGEDVFRDGVRAYMKKHAFGNADAGEFLDAVGAAAGRDLRTPFFTFLEQVGSPLVTVALSCEKGETPTLALSQARYVPTGSDASTAHTWQFPVCASYPVGKTVARSCTLMTEQTATLPLAEATRCPAWVLPNAGMNGYYRTAYEGKLLATLLAKGLRTLSLPEQIGVVGDVAALVEAGNVDYGTALALVDRMSKTHNRHIIGQAAGIVAGIDDMVPTALRGTYAGFVRKTFGTHARKLGWTAKDGEDDDTRLLRASLLGVVVVQGEDETLARAARPMALAWLEDPTAVDANLVGMVLDTAAMYGDAALWDTYYKAAKAEPDQNRRRLLLGSLAKFRDPALVQRSLALVTSGEFDTREAVGLLMGGLRTPHTRRATYEHVKDNWDAVTAIMPKRFGAYLVYAGVGQCDAALAPEVRAFFEPRLAELPGGPRTYAQAMEQMDLCIAGRVAQTPGVTAFLRKL